MIFQGKIDRARAFQKEQMQGQQLAMENEDLENVIEKNDTLALILSALLVFVPAALIFLVILCFIGYLFIFH